MILDVGIRVFEKLLGTQSNYRVCTPIQAVSLHNSDQYKIGIKVKKDHTYIIMLRGKPHQEIDYVCSLIKDFYS